MDEAQRLAIGERVKECRERSPYSQKALARVLGYETTRGYQKIEQKGTTRYEHIEKLAETFGVSVDWLWTGEEKPSVPDLMGQMNGSTDDERLARMEQTLEELVAEVKRLTASQSD